MPKTRQFSRVQFQVEAPIGHGQSIYVTGNGPALGDNDPLAAVALYTTPAEYPRWSSDWGTSFLLLFSFYACFASAIPPSFSSLYACFASPIPTHPPTHLPT